MGNHGDNGGLLEARVGLVPLGGLNVRAARRAYRRSLPTMDHATRVFDAVVVRLGEDGWIDPEGGADRKRLYRFEGGRHGWLIAQSLAEWKTARGATSFVGPVMFNPNAALPADAPPGWKYGDPWFEPIDPPPEVYPRGPTMHAGALTVRCGGAYVEAVYDGRGLFRESSATVGDLHTAGIYDGLRPFTLDPSARPPATPPLPILFRADLAEGGVSVDALARMIVELDAAAVPARVRLPAPGPGGVEGVWRCGLAGLRTALWSESAPAMASWVIADGFEGTAVAFGETVDEAWARWQGALFRTKPRPRSPEASAPPPTPTAPETIRDDAGTPIGFSTGTVTLTGFAGADIPWPAAVPARTPAAMVGVGPLPPSVPDAYAAAGFTRWVRVLGELGHVRHVLVRDEVDGLTLVGEGAIDLVDPATLRDDIDAALARRSARYAGMPVSVRPWDDPSYKWGIMRLAAWDNRRQRPMALDEYGGSFGQSFTPSSLDGDALAWCVTRVTRYDRTPNAT